MEGNSSVTNSASYVLDFSDSAILELISIR